MLLADSTGARRRVGAAIAAAIIFTTLALAIAIPAWTQTPSAPSPAEVRPRLHGYLLDDGEFTFIDAPDAILGTGALGINNRGQIVGATLLTLTTENGFLLRKGAFTTIQFPGTSSTGVADINERGQIVGAYVDGSNTTHGFLLDKGVVSTIDVPGAFATSARRINARGQIVGAYSDFSNTRPITPLRGFLLEDGVFTRIDVPGASETLPEGINDHGQIVGSYADANGTIHGFLLDKGVFTTIDVPEAAVPGRAPGFSSGAALGTGAIGINNRGQIVGQYGAADGRIHGFLLDDGVFTTIDAPGAINTNASDINERGQIVGFYLGTNEGQ